MKERISALMDGELDEAELTRDLIRLKENTDLKRAWETYHLIGDTIRGHAGPTLAAGVRARLTVEPTVLAPRRRAQGGKIAQIAYSAAAGAAGVALVAWLALPGLNPEPAQLAASVPPGAGARAAVTAPAITPKAVGLENYLLAHQSYSPTGATQGVAPYVRTVADQSEGGGK
jgi:sigma-E factor negative regulatory protein RseA